MAKKIAPSILSTICCSMFLILSSPHIQADEQFSNPSEQEIILQLILAEHKVNLDKFKTCSIKRTETIDEERKKSHGKYNYSEIYNDKKSWVEVKRDLKYTESGKEQAEESVIRLVLNDDYLAFWHQGTALAYIYPYENSLTAPMALRMKDACKVGRTLKHGYGCGKYSLEHVYHDWMSGANRKCVINFQNNKYRIELYYHKDDQAPGWTFVVEPSMGYAIVRVEMRLSDGRRIRDYDVTMAKMEDGTWYPKAWTSYSYERSTNASEKIVSRLHSVVEIFEVGTPSNDYQFSWKSLQAPEDCRFVQEDETGEIQSMVINNGELIPIEVYGQLNQ